MSRILIAGVDEAGRGPLVGNVVAAAVILDPANPIDGLADSKKLTEKKREQLFEVIYQRALAVSVAEATPAEIDAINILHASMLAMRRAVLSLALVPDKVLIDGNRCPELPMLSEAIIKGDQKEACISAASIIAKVTRDRQMYTLHEQYPQYGFAGHKGYPTKTHVTALMQHGATPFHRKSFGPVMAFLNEVEYT